MKTKKQRLIDLVKEKKTLKGLITYEIIDDKLVRVSHGGNYLNFIKAINRMEDSLGRITRFEYIDLIEKEV